MSLLLYVLTATLSFISTCIMSYIAMAIDIGPWVAPIVSIVFMLLLFQGIQKDWVQKNIVLGIAGGSVGGMVGMCVGLTWPTFYFLHGNTFASWIASPFKFAGMVGLLTLAAGCIAFLITFFLREHLIVEHKLRYPMSTLVHDIVYMDKKTKKSAMMAHSVAIASSWNIFTWIARLPLQHYLVYLHAIPVFVSIGFIAGHTIAIPLLIGMLSRVVILMTVKETFFYFEKEETFLLTFASGMLFAVIVMSLYYLLRSLYVKTGKQTQLHFILLVKRFAHSRIYVTALLLSLVLCSAVFTSWGIVWMQQFYILVALFFLCNVVAKIIGDVGVLDIQSFVSFIMLPLIYISHMHSLQALVTTVFCTICLGVVIDLMFSYKLAHLAKVDYQKILKFQIIGFIVAACSIGFVLWWYIKTFTLGSVNLSAQQALHQEAFITFGSYNYYVLTLGFMFGAILFMLYTEMLVVIGGFMMPVYMAFWLILAGAVSYLTSRPQKYYPFWFGVYASHALWMLIRISV